MDRRQQELRHTAAREFMQSLDELQEILQKERQSSEGQALPSEKVNPQQTKTSESPPHTLTAFEQAAADIEQFFQI